MDKKQSKKNQKKKNTPETLVNVNFHQELKIL